MDAAGLIHNPLTRFIAQAVAIIAVSRVLALGVRRLGQPQVIAEVTAGIVLGPSLLGVLWPQATALLFPPESLGILQLVSQVGLVLFMFLIGLELDPGLLKGRGRASIAISHSSIVVPFALGSGLAFWLYPRLSDPKVPFLAFTLFLGVAMSITAFPVLARILSERRLLGTRVGAVAITCAAVDDVTAWCLLAFVVAVASVERLSGAVITSIAALVYLAAMFWVVRPLLARLGARVGGRDGLTQNLVALILLLLLLSSWATEVIGIHALFGAFCFGVVLPKQGGLSRALADKIEDLVLAMFLPLFFAYSGVRTHIGLLDTVDEWFICAAIVLVACVGKFGGSAIAARLTGLSWREAGALGILMNTRGLMELIVLNIGLDLGVISGTLFTMMVVMALVTTFMTTPVLERVYPLSLMHRHSLSPPGIRLETPLPLPGKPRAAYNVLVCVAHDRSGPGLLMLANALRGQDRVRVHALHLVGSSDRASFFLEGEAAGQTRDPVLEPLLAKARELEVEVRPLSFVSSDPAEDIRHVAELKRAGLVLMGWHKPVFSQTFLGGTVYRVLRDAPSNVGVFVDRGLQRVNRILVPFIGSVHDRAAVALARRILGRDEVEVTLLHVRDPVAGDAEGARDSDDVIDEPAGGRVVVRVVHHASPVDAALAEMEGGYDLAIIGAGREWGLEQRLLGVQRERLVLESKTSLLIVRGVASAEAESLELSSAPSPA
jgi:Kef-type K+ transport system membrane component KefB/nucleotide-binding universal stress UspA family protein